MGREREAVRVGGRGGGGERQVEAGRFFCTASTLSGWEKLVIVEGDERLAGWRATLNKNGLTRRAHRAPTARPSPQP